MGVGVEGEGDGRLSVTEVIGARLVRCLVPFGAASQQRKPRRLTGARPDRILCAGGNLGERRTPVAVGVGELAGTIDHTLLKPDAKEGDVRGLCEEAARHHFASVCIPPGYVRFAAKELRGTDVMVATVVSFPFG